MMSRNDPDLVRDVKLERTSVRRAWTFAQPYRGTILVFLAAIVAEAVLALVPPLAFRSIIDRAIPRADRSLITWLAALVVTAALADAGLAILQRWCSARIGAGLIYDLRVALFAKVQRMPIAFFTRTQTGALTSMSAVSFKNLSACTRRIGPAQ